MDKKTIACSKWDTGEEFSIETRRIIEGTSMYRNCQPVLEITTKPDETVKEIFVDGIWLPNNPNGGGIKHFKTNIK